MANSEQFFKRELNTNSEEQQDNTDFSHLLNLMNIVNKTKSMRTGDDPCYKKADD